MAKGIELGLLAAILLSSMISCTSGAGTSREYIVGQGYSDDVNYPYWRSCCNLDYSVWAAKNEFVVGDVLVFYFDIRYSTVAEVGVDAYNSCKSARPSDIKTVSPARLPLKHAGFTYFIATGDYCTTQRLSVNVKANSAADSSPPPSSSNKKETPPADQSTSSDSGGGLSKAKLAASIVGPVGTVLVAGISGYVGYKKKKLKQQQKKDLAAYGERSTSGSPAPLVGKV